jgi:diguanylate cyclase (GGDEF)-like protein
MSPMGCLVRLAFNTVYLALVLAIALRIFEPFPADADPAIRLFGQLKPWIDPIAHWAAWPMTTLGHLVLPHLPPVAYHWWPTHPAANLLEDFNALLLHLPWLKEQTFLQRLAQTPYHRLYPGVMDFRLLASLGFWLWVEGTLEMLKRRSREAMSRMTRAARFQQMTQTAYQQLVQQRDDLAQQLAQERHPGRMRAEIAPLLQDIYLENETLGAQSQRDPLTRLHNRAYLLQVLRQTLDNAHQYGLRIGLMMLDMDNFKRLNDTQGHVAGDQALQAVAQTLSATCKTKNALAFRYGGEEFAILVQPTSEEDLLAFAEQVREAVQSLRVPQLPDVQLSASIGVCSANLASAALRLSPEAFINHADQALLKVKQSGQKNRVEWVGL